MGIAFFFKGAIFPRSFLGFYGKMIKGRKLGIKTQRYYRISDVIINQKSSLELGEWLDLPSKKSIQKSPQQWGDFFLGNIVFAKLVSVLNGTR
jgi:hypothetical protein